MKSTSNISQGGFSGSANIWMGGILGGIILRNGGNLGLSYRLYHCGHHRN